MVVHDSLEFHNDCDDYGQYLDDNLEHNLDGDYEWYVLNINNVIDIRSYLEYTYSMKYYFYMGIGYVVYVIIFAYIMTTYFGY